MLTRAAYWRRPSWGWQLLLAPVISLLAFTAQHLVIPRPEVAPFAFFYAGVAAVAWVGGQLPALLSVCTSAVLANYAFLEPRWAWSSSSSAVIGTGVFVHTSALIALFVHTARDASMRAAAAADSFERAQEVAHLGSWELDAFTNQLVWSDEVYRIFGLEPRQFGASYEAFMGAVHPEDRSAVDAAYKGSLQSGSASYEIEHRIVRPGGEIRFVHEQCVHQRSSSGRVIRSIGVVQDVTELWHTEEALRQANERLRESDHRKDEFLAVLSHELRNPLAPIRNSLHILNRVEGGSDQARRSREVIGRQLDHLTRLVGDLLDVSRITRGKIQLQPQLMDLREVVGQSVQDHRSVFTSRGITLLADLGGEPCWAKVDAPRLAQALENLLHNAAKFTPRDGTVWVHLSRGPVATTVRVQDTGAGIAPELLPKLFEPFSQGNARGDRSDGGLGLGLALARGLVELHGGTLEGASDGPGRGAEFTLRVPSAACPEPVAMREKERPAPSHRRVLVIDDNVDAAESLRSLLELEGHEVAVAYSGAEGLSRARSSPPEVVLCDIGMPGMDGYAVARAFRSDERLREIRLVALTGYAQASDRQKTLDAGFSAHLAKPPNLEMLAEAIQGGDRASIRAPGGAALG